MNQKRITKSKYFFEQFKDEIQEEHKNLKTRSETTNLSPDRCNHKGKVKVVDSMLRCSCGAAWSGPQLDTLLDLFNK